MWAVHLVEYYSAVKKEWSYSMGGPRNMLRNERGQAQDQADLQPEVDRRFPRALGHIPPACVRLGHAQSQD